MGDPALRSVGRTALQPMVQGTWLRSLYVCTYNLFGGTVLMQQHGPLPPGGERRAFLEAQPTYWLKRCYQALRRMADAELRRYGLTLSQRDVLLALWDEGPLGQSPLRERPA